MGVGLGMGVKHFLSTIYSVVVVAVVVVLGGELIRGTWCLLPGTFYT